MTGDEMIHGQAGRRRGVMLAAWARARRAVGAMALGALAANGARAQGVTTRVELVPSGTTQLLVGLHVVSERVLWASGAGGTVLRTTDGGTTWRATVVAGAEKMQFRDVHATDSLHAWVLAIGNADSSRIYRTTDGGVSWQRTFTNDDPAAFYDCFAWWDARRAIVMGDGVRGRTPVRLTSDAGATWTAIARERQPVADSGEGSLAASGSCVAVAGTRHAWIGTVGSAAGARVLSSTDGGQTWGASVTPIGGGAKGAFAASVVFRDTLVGFAGGDPAPQVARTTDGGRTWTATGSPALGGPLYGLALRGARSPLLAVGPKGASVSTDDGAHWRLVHEGNWWHAEFASDTVAWLVGPRGALARVRLSRMGGSAAPAGGPATLLLLHGRVLTVDAQDRVAQAVAIRGNRIVGVGTDAEMEALAAPNAKRLDLNGRTVTPGLIDAHVHFARGGTEQIKHVPLSFPLVKSIPDVVRAVAERAKGTPAGRWVEGSGWDEGKLAERRYVTAKDLDAATSRHPVYLEHTTGHYAVVNTRALQMAGITRDTKDPPGGTIDRDAEGNPTGVLKESAQELVGRLIPPVSRADLAKGIAAMARQFNAEGMTAAKDPGIEDDAWAAYQQVAKAGDLSVRVFTLWQGGTRMADAERIIRTHGAITRPYEAAGAGPLIAGGVKLFLDGSGGARTAWVYDEWYKEGVLDAGNRGYPASNPDTLTAMIRRFHDAGLHVSVHSIGDRAIDVTLAAFRAALAANPVRGLRHGIIHANLPTDSAIQLMATLERTMDAGYPEPSAAFAWWIGDLYGSTFGPARSARLNPFKTFERNGIPWANGSDFFVTPFPARYGIWSAMARETLLGKFGKTPFGMAEAVDARAALRAVTIWAARQLFLEQEVGSIEVGKRADLAVWDRDFYSAPVADVKEARCLLTLFDGREVHRAKGAAF